MSEPGIDHPLEQEVVVEYEHPGGEEAVGEVWDCWGSDPLVYEILDLDDFARVGIRADDIKTVVEGSHDDVPSCVRCGEPVPESEAAPGPAGHVVHEECGSDD